MKLFQISDLHLGKQLHGYSLLDEQKYILQQIVERAQEERPDVLLVCGDIYDRSVPSGEAMALFDEFLVKLGGLPFTLPVLVIAGNHDSPERLRYGRDFLRAHHIYISVLPPQSREEHLEKVVLEDEWGFVNFYLLPFVRPGMVRHYMPEEAARGEESIICNLLGQEDIKEEERNVLLSHQFYISGGKLPERCDSEQPRVNVGGLDAVDCSAVDVFDYVALGHIHSPQEIGKEGIRYCGSPLQYSVSEAGQKKGILVAELREKGSRADIRQIPLTPLREIKCLRGSLEELIAQAGQGNGEDYVSLTVTQEEIPDQLRQLLEPYYKGILEIVVDNARSRHILEESQEAIDYQEMSPDQAFRLFFRETQGRDMSEEEFSLLQEIIREGEEDEAD